MDTLETYLRAAGYHTESPTLPTTFGTLEECTAQFEQAFTELAGEYTRIHLVGHSLGGLVIRSFLAQNRAPTLGRCVLIATPNGGTGLAGFAKKYFPFSLALYRSLEDIQPGGPDIPEPLQTPPPEIGAIAGNDSNLLLGRFIEGDNDGRVPVESVPFDGMSDFTVVPYGHHNIHHTAEVAMLVGAFLRTGSFGVYKR